MKIERELHKDFKDEQELMRQIDLYNFQIEEIEEAELDEIEDENIDEEYRVMANSEYILENMIQTKNIIDKDLYEISKAISYMGENSSKTNKYDKMLERIRSSYYELEEVGYDLEDEIENISVDKERANQIERRFDIINTLKRKYGNSIKEILAYLEKIKKEAEKLKNFEEYTKELEEKKEELEKLLKKLAEDIHKKRIKAAEEISDKITKQLHDVEMLQSIFKIEVNKKDEFNKYGMDEVDFKIMTNKGSNFGSISKIASRWRNE